MKLSLLVISLFFYFYSPAQELHLIKSIEIDEPTEVSIDRGGSIYYATFNGDIIRLDADFNDKLIFSPNNPNTTTILEAWQGLRIFSFHRDLQQYRLINRNLSLHEDYSFPQQLISFAEIATSSYDNNIWVFDQVDFSLKKFDITARRLSSRTPMEQLLDPDNYEILFCKEYQNRLFMSTRNHGILIFDNFGTYIKTFQFKGITFFNFWGDMIYFIDEQKLIQLNLYNEKLEERSLPKNSLWLFSLIFEDRLYLFSKNSIECYK